MLPVSYSILKAACFAGYHKKPGTEEKINYNKMKTIFSEVKSLLQIFTKEKYWNYG
jgi:hypothetical protein